MTENKKRKWGLHCSGGCGFAQEEAMPPKDFWLRPCLCYHQCNVQGWFCRDCYHKFLFICDGCKETTVGERMADFVYEGRAIWGSKNKTKLTKEDLEQFASNQSIWMEAKRKYMKENGLYSKLI